MSIELEDIHVFDDHLAQHIRVTEEGLSAQDQMRLTQMALDLIAGRIDVIAVTLADGVEPSKELNDLLVDQLGAIFKPFSSNEPLVLPGRRGNYSPLHVDAERNKFGEFMQQVEVRVHCNLGRHADLNCPEGRAPKHLEPFFIFGRAKRVEVDQWSVLQSFDGFAPSLAINLMRPTWNIFRAHGRHSFMSPNAPVTHAVLPRELAEAALDPDAKFYPMVNDDQVVLADGTARKVTAKNCPLVDSKGADLGYSREYGIVNFSIDRAQLSRDSLVA